MVRLWAGMRSPGAIASYLILGTGWMAFVPGPSAADKQDITRRFQFERYSLPMEVRPQTGFLAPDFQRMEPWLSAFLPSGAMMVDLDQNGRSDEACITDGFSNQVWVLATPGHPTPFPAFTLDISSATQGNRGRPTGCLAGDYDEDGQEDLLISFWGHAPLILLQMPSAPGQGLTTQSFRPTKLLPTPERWYTQSVTRADIDGDGHLDLLVGNYFPDNMAVLNDDLGGAPSRMNQGWASAYNGAYNRLLLGRPTEHGQVNFVEVKNAFGDDLGGSQWTIAVAAQDVSGDLLPELFFINDHGPDRLLFNESTPGKPRFSLVRNSRTFLAPKSKTLGRDDFHGMGIDFADFNRDGALDWMVTNFGASYLFQQSHQLWIHTQQSDAFLRGVAPFEDHSEEYGLARTAGVPWDVRMADFDNDGNIEVVASSGFMRGDINMAAHLQEMALHGDFVLEYPEVWHTFPSNGDVGGQAANAFFARATQANGRYHDFGDLLGFAEAAVSRGIASADPDGDGRLDLIVANQRAPATYLQNRSPDTYGFLGLKLRLVLNSRTPAELASEPGLKSDHGHRISRTAVGASVTIVTSGSERIAASVDGGSGASGKRDGIIHVGLGTPQSEPYEVTVKWRDGEAALQTQTLRLAPGYHTIWLGDSPMYAEAR